MADELSSRRGGRPRKEQAGDVERRLLDAATALFLTRGFDATSCDEVASDAGAGKASLYARFGSKEALLAAVMKRETERLTLSLRVVLDHERPARDRVRAAALAVLEHASQPRSIALLRLLVANAPRLGELSEMAHVAWRDAAVECVRDAIVVMGDLTGPTASPMSPSRLAEQLVDLVLDRHRMRLLLVEDAELLRHQAAEAVDEALRFVGVD